MAFPGAENDTEATEFYKQLQKAKVALEAVQGLKTVSQLAHRHKVHPNQVMQRKRQLLESEEHLCEGGLSKAVNCDERRFYIFMKGL